MIQFDSHWDPRRTTKVQPALSPAAQAVLDAAMATVGHEAFVPLIEKSLAIAFRALAAQITAGDPPYGIINEHFAIELGATERIQKFVLAIADELDLPMQP
jgi:hypothetical protein